MKIIENLSELNKKFFLPVVALGVFDGIHLGHMSVINRATAIAKKIAGTAMVFTFANHPRSVINPEVKLTTINVKEVRRNIFSSLNIEVLIEIPFTKIISEITPNEFLNFLHEKISPAYIVVGENYTFGSFGNGDINTLIRESKNHAFQVEICNEVIIDGEAVSSTRIRKLIFEGKLSEANRLLGRNFTYASKIIHGSGRGNTFGFPTANLIFPDEQAMLPNGVYIVRVKIDDRTFNGIANIGDNPTFRLKRRRLEVFIDDFNENIYGEKIFVEFVKKLRDEKIFKSIDELKEQLLKDLKNMRSITKCW